MYMLVTLVLLPDLPRSSRKQALMLGTPLSRLSRLVRSYRLWGG